MNRDNFITMIKNAVFLQKAHDVFSHIKFDNDTCMCPFCEKEMKPKKKDGGWVQTCKCEDSIFHKNSIEELLVEKSHIEEKLNKMHEKVYYKALKLFKLYYTDVIAPELRHQYDKNMKEILSIEKLS